MDTLTAFVREAAQSRDEKWTHTSLPLSDVPRTLQRTVNSVLQAAPVSASLINSQAERRRMRIDVCSGDTTVSLLHGGLRNGLEFMGAARENGVPQPSLQLRNSLELVSIGGTALGNRSLVLRGNDAAAADGDDERDWAAEAKDVMNDSVPTATAASPVLRYHLLRWVVQHQTSPALLVPQDINIHAPVHNDLVYVLGFRRLTYQLRDAATGTRWERHYYYREAQPLPLLSEERVWHMLNRDPSPQAAGPDSGRSMLGLLTESALHMPAADSFDAWVNDWLHDLEDEAPVEGKGLELWVRRTLGFSFTKTQGGLEVRRGAEVDAAAHVRRAHMQRLRENGDDDADAQAEWDASVPGNRPVPLLFTLQDLSEDRKFQADAPRWAVGRFKASEAAADRDVLAALAVLEGVFGQRVDAGNMATPAMAATWRRFGARDILRRSELLSTLLLAGTPGLEPRALTMPLHVPDGTADVEERCYFDDGPDFVRMRAHRADGGASLEVKRRGLDLRPRARPYAVLLQLRAALEFGARRVVLKAKDLRDGHEDVDATLMRRFLFHERSVASTIGDEPRLCLELDASDMATAAFACLRDIVRPWETVGADTRFRSDALAEMGGGNHGLRACRFRPSAATRAQVSTVDAALNPAAATILRGPASVAMRAGAWEVFEATADPLHKGMRERHAFKRGRDLAVVGAGPALPQPPYMTGSVTGCRGRPGPEDCLVQLDPVVTSALVCSSLPLRLSIISKRYVRSTQQEEEDRAPEYVVQQQAAAAAAEAKAEAEAKSDGAGDGDDAEVRALRVSRQSLSKRDRPCNNEAWQPGDPTVEDCWRRGFATGHIVGQRSEGHYATSPAEGFKKLGIVGARVKGDGSGGAARFPDGYVPRDGERPPSTSVIHGSLNSANTRQTLRNQNMQKLQRLRHAQVQRHGRPNREQRHAERVLDVYLS